ncbi:MAG: SDR family NAD(P)-dependent oxidoreductase [Halanaerobiales bacterium]|nr:SDR family NAD(P)-dependent oxidoreductase [Halanaerobiales bacterium]
MDRLFKFIIENTKQGKIDKEAAIEMVKLAKQVDIKETEDIAIIGMAGKMPLAENVEEYWHNLECGLDCITPIPELRSKDLTDYLTYINTPEEEIKFCVNGYMEEIDKFDYKLFRLSYKEASLMDPNQKIFLETVWQAIEDAGYGGNKLRGSNTGIYAGFSSILRDIYLQQVYDVEPTALPISLIGNLSSVIPSRIAYLFDLKGPSMLIDTACSSSLVAITQACDALRNKKCDMAIAGGIKVNLLPRDHELMRIGIESSDRRTRAFDNTSDGSGIGEGVGAIILKPLKKALKDGDNVYAVIKGYAVNQDGNCVGITAPNPAAQTDVILKAWKDAKVEPETMSYIETHGTGTKLGDPIEIKGITDAFRKHTNKKQFCAIGSVKGNVGHSSEAAGVLSIIKTVMALKSKKIPPSLYFGIPNQASKFSELPIYVNTRSREWETNGFPRRCGVSAFGISGTNCHMILEEAPVYLKENRQVPLVDVLTLSAKTELGLITLVKQYIEYIRKNESTEVSDISYTANTGRGHYNYRLAILYRDQEDLLNKLKNFQDSKQIEKDIFYGFFKVIGNNKVKNQAFEITEEERLVFEKQAKLETEKYLSTQGANVDILEQICQLYKSGADIDWESMYKDSDRVKVSLPTYPFERERCWLDIPQRINEVQDDEKDMYFTVEWNNNEISAESSLQDDGVVIIFKDSKGIWKKFYSKWSEFGVDIRTVEFGNEYCEESNGNFIIRGEEEDYDKILLGIEEGKLSRIIHLASIDEKLEINSYEELKKSQVRGVYSLFYLIRAIVRARLDSNVNINIISEYVYDVTGNESEIYPENAPLLGIGKVIYQEHPDLKVKCIDIDKNMCFESILNEMGISENIYQVAYREGKRYIEEFKEIDIETVEDKPIEIKEDGVYLITGGTGGMGLEIAAYLASFNKIKIALLAKSPIPEKNQWDTILSANEDKKLCKKINGIRRIEEKGAEVVYYSTDISNLKESEKVINDLKAKYGKISGVIHAAGIPGDGILFIKSQEAFDQVFNPKVFGTWVLEKITRNEDLDFFVMFSSGQSILGEPGYGDYTAANSYLDSFAPFMRRKNRKALTINWTTWKETGMAVDYDVNHDALFTALTTEKALEGFGGILGKEISRILIGELSYLPQFLFLLENLPFKLSEKISEKIQIVLDQNKKNKKVNKNDQFVKQSGTMELKGRDGEEFSEIEIKVAEIYNEILGYMEIDINDSFFELGGDSVMINRMHIILDQEYPGVVKLIDLFNYTTVASLSKYIASKVGGETESNIDQELEDLNQMLKNVEEGNINIDEAMDLIK